ncbi:hypothetical protein [Occallatibacter riparius]|uniref:Uncharacterized protein n=1 Tax=Occallatibacter riparius TaxID=1002689 RepID=A0A9J7BK31_9BACT|nr:hypothetical protein [Occallatibacter riparius]UWZ82809.1 hypothetical protein MOP44_19845 [Occallatibacter riparius]
MQVAPGGLWLLEAVSGSGTLSAIPLDYTTGLPADGASAQSVALPSSNVPQLAMSPSNSTHPYLFVAMAAHGTAVIPFSAGNTNPLGAIRTIPVMSSTGEATAVAVDVANRLLFVGETAALPGTQSGGVRVFDITSNIGELSDSPYRTGGTGPAAILATEYYVYVANKSVSGSTKGNIAGFAITETGSEYSLTTLSSIAAGIATVGLAEDNTLTYIAAANSGGGPDLNVYTFDSSTHGKLDSVTTGSIDAGANQAVAIAATP